ncbi:hypothetical protein GH714_021966 [Hevea brasiliensis]|uniref:Glycoside hydrolase family 19 catalytic domain-containing protein n=1 Tax=Hevea brasiliensis TaxID=3981 RepID=A0A6A6MLB8_HEVBR|nr:hypothetical protein GH714_021966 [Hevea brasiliensis]
MDKAEDSCERKNFYSREKFLNALKSYPRFGTDGSVDESKREIAAFFAHVTHETSHFCYVEEKGSRPPGNYCDEENTKYPCNPRKVTMAADQFNYQ